MKRLDYNYESDIAIGRTQAALAILLVGGAACSQGWPLLVPGVVLIVCAGDLYRITILSSGVAAHREIRAAAERWWRPWNFARVCWQERHKRSTLAAEDAEHEAKK